jgi:hypothetical protein
LSDEGGEKSRSRRDYRPSLEAVESLRLLSSASAGAMFPGLAAVHDLPADPGPAAPTSVARSAAISNATWNAALVQTQLAELRSEVGPTTANPTRTAASTIDPTSLSSGLTQLNKYLSRAAARVLVGGVRGSGGDRGVPW